MCVAMGHGVGQPIYEFIAAAADGASGDAASNLGATISTGGLFFAFGSSASNFSTGGGPGGGIFVVDPASGRSAIIPETANSPLDLAANGVIVLTGDLSGSTLSTSDQSGRFTASLDANGDIQSPFTEPKSEVA